MFGKSHKHADMTMQPVGLQRPFQAAGHPLPPTHTLTHTLTRSHSDSSSHLGFLRTRHLMALWLNDQMLGRHVCDTKHCALPHLILPTTIVISSLLTRNVKLREAKERAQGHPGGRWHSHSRPRVQSPPSRPWHDPDSRKDRQMDARMSGGWVGLHLFPWPSSWPPGLSSPHKSVVGNRPPLKAETDFHERQSVGPK